MFKYLIFFALGTIASKFFNSNSGSGKMIQRVQTASVLSILFIMGITLGQNDQVFGQLGKLGFRSIWIALAPMVGSAVLVFLYEKFIYGRKGDN